MKSNNKLKLLIILFFIISLIYPVATMLNKIEWNSFKTLITSLSFKEALTNSLIISSISTIISLVLAFLLAYSLNRTNIKRRALLKVLLTVPMLIPSISHGLGLINLFGTNGILTKIFGFNLIGKSGIIISSIMYSFPIAFLMIDDGFNYIDNKLYEAAKILGLNKWQTFKKVTLCYLKKPVLSSLFAIFTLIFTDYGIPLSIGGKFITLPVFLYKEVIGLLDFSKGIMISLFLLIPALISFLFDNLTKDYTTGDFGGKKFHINTNKKRDIICTTFVYTILILIILIIGSFVYYAFIDNIILNNTFSLKHINYVFNNNFGKYLFNSIIISSLVSIFGTSFAYFAAYVTARIKGRLSNIIHILTILSLAIPGIVLGLSFTIAFKNTIIYNRYFILVLVNIIHFIASPYLMACNALQKINPNYEVIAKTCNISLFNIIKDVIIPTTKKTIREMLAYFFVNSMITISAVTFLFSTKTMPVSLLINNYIGNMMLGEAAVISLIILIINIIVKGSVYLINRHEYRKEEYREINI